MPAIYQLARVGILFYIYESTYAKGKTAPPASSYMEMPGMKGVTVPIGKYADTGIKNVLILVILQLDFFTL